jgi:hypothetical protein
MSASKTMASAGVESAGSVVAPRVPAGIVSPLGVPAGAGASARRRRSRAAISVDELIRGAPPEVLARPAGEVLDAVPWSGASPDPDVLDAVTFLAWL